MTEPTLALTYDNLLAEVSWFLGFGYDTSALTADQTAECDRIVQSGYRQVLVPLGPDGETHVWSFLSPKATLAIVGSTEDYDLPDDFGGIEGDLTFSTAQHLPPVFVLGEGQIRGWRAHSTITGKPRYAAVRPKACTGATEGQRFELLIWPVPDASYTLEYRYNVQRNKLTTSNPYPVGGAVHAETLKASCLAAAELAKDEDRGPQWEQFRTLLAASISLDKRTSAPEYLGYNGDNSDEVTATMSRVRYVTVYGVRQN